MSAKIDSLYPWDFLLIIAAEYVIKFHCRKETLLVHIPFIPQNSQILFWILSDHSECTDIFFLSQFLHLCLLEFMDACSPVLSAYWSPDKQIPESTWVCYFRV